MTFSIRRFLSIHLGVFLFFLTIGFTDFSLQDNEINTAKEYVKQGKSFFNAEDYEKSRAYFDKAILIAKELEDDKFVSFIYVMKGHAYLREGKNQEALDAYYTSLDIAQKLNDSNQEVIANSGLIVVLKRMNQLDKALEIARQMIKSSNKPVFKNKKNHVRIIATTSEVYLDKELYDSVLPHIEKGIAISKSLDYKEGLVDLYIKKGMIFYYKDNYKESFNYLFKAQDLLNKYSIKKKFYPTVNSNYFIARCYYQQKVYDKSIEYLLKTIHIMEEKDLGKPPVIQSYLLLANSYGEKKNLEKALYWHNEYLKLNKNYQKNKDRTVNKIFEKEAKKLEGEIEGLKIKQIASERTRKYLGIGFIALFVVLLFFVFRHFKNQKSNKIVFDDLIKKINHLESQEQKPASDKGVITEVIIDDAKVNEVLKELQKLEDQEFFLRPNCNLTSMSKKVKTNVTYLSKIINTHKQTSFNDYVNDLRIDYVLKRLKNDKKLRSFSIKSIAIEVGYKSDYSFAKHFKAKTGLYPSYYIKNIEKQEITS